MRSLAYREAGVVLEFGRGRADPHGVAARGDGELAAALVEVREVAGPEAEQDEPALAGGEVDRGVALELLGRLLCGRRRGRYSSSVAGPDCEEVFVTRAATVATPLPGL